MKEIIMTINNANVEQINIALLDIDKRIKALNADSETLKSLQDSVKLIKSSLNETKAGLTGGATYNINISGNAATATQATTAISAIRASTAESADEAGHAITATNATSATTAQSAEVANHANTADSATTANHAETATNATSANHAENATNAETATNANHAETAETATTAGTADKAINGTFGVLGGAKLAVSENFNDLLNNELCNNINGGLMGGSIWTTTSSLGLGAGWWNFLYIPHRTGLDGDNISYGTLLVTPLLENNGVLYIIHRINNNNFNAHKFQSVT